jgi:hypothetical protein
MTHSPILALALALALGPVMAAAEDDAGREPLAPDAAPGPVEVPSAPPGPSGLTLLASESPEAGLAPPAPVLVSPAGPSLLNPLEERPRFAVLPVVASVVPGLLFHGLGPLLDGDSRTAGRLFALEGTALGLTAAGLVPIALTGASRRTIGPLYALTLSGVGLFALSALSNLYSVTSPAFEPGVPPASLPPLELELGYQYVSDPQFTYGHFLTLGAVSRWDALRLEALARFSPDDANTRLRLGGGYRLAGKPERALAGSDGSSLDVEGGVFLHRYPTETFTLAGLDVALRGRFAMARLSPRLAGSFTEMSVGTSFLGYHYSGGVSDDAMHQNLLVTFGYGVWLGRGGPLRGEALLYYNHRKDDFAGGLIAMGDIPGHFGLRGRVLLNERWGVGAELQAGSAYVGRLSFLYALGGEP